MFDNTDKASYRGMNRVNVGGNYGDCGKPSPDGLLPMEVIASPDRSVPQSLTVSNSESNSNVGFTKTKGTLNIHAHTQRGRENKIAIGRQTDRHIEQRTANITRKEHR